MRHVGEPVAGAAAAFAAVPAIDSGWDVTGSACVALFRVHLS